MRRQVENCTGAGIGFIKCTKKKWNISDRITRLFISIGMGDTALEQV